VRKPCVLPPGYSKVLELVGGKCKDCVGHDHEVVFKEEAWGNRWTCSCCGRTYYFSIGD